MSLILARRLAAMAEKARGPQPVDTTGWGEALERASKIVAEHQHKWILAVDTTGELFHAECACGQKKEMS